MIDQRSRNKRKAYKKAVSTLFHVVENYPASLKTNADETNTSAQEAHRQLLSYARLTADLTATPANDDEP
jgi:hypothetical protein